ncbi:MAG: hypothetical protein K0R81_3228, partial [Microbacterium sp.]|nr:hypothetical protein [Microbacterium sp.]
RAAPSSVDCCGALGTRAPARRVVLRRHAARLPGGCTPSGRRRCGRAAAPRRSARLGEDPRRTSPGRAPGEADGGLRPDARDPRAVGRYGPRPRARRHGRVGGLGRARRPDRSDVSIDQRAGLRVALRRPRSRPVAGGARGRRPRHRGRGGLARRAVREQPDRLPARHPVSRAGDPPIVGATGCHGPRHRVAPERARPHRPPGRPRCRDDRAGRVSPPPRPLGARRRRSHRPDSGGGAGASGHRSHRHSADARRCRRVRQLHLAPR